MLDTETDEDEPTPTVPTAGIHPQGVAAIENVLMERQRRMRELEALDQQSTTAAAQQQLQQQDHGQSTSDTS
jgi:hypothetical protein